MTPFSLMYCVRRSARTLPRRGAVAADLARDPGPWLVHTDLHYGNILASERAGHPWVAIDR